jgi:branched-chain amino acid transport system substrate-binding protein
VKPGRSKSSSLPEKSAIARSTARHKVRPVKFLTVAALFATLVFSGCGKKPAPAASQPSPTPEPTPIEDPQATRLGLLIPLTGEQASFGQDAVRGAQLAADEINAAGGILGHPLILKVKDTQSLPQRINSATTELIDAEKVATIVGEIATDRSLAAAPIAQARGVPMVTPGSTNEQVTQVGDSIFRVCYTDSFQAVVMAKFARSIAVERAAILSDPSDPYSAGLAAIFKKDFTAAGGTIVAEETYNPGDTSFSRQLDAIRAKEPEVVFLPSYFPDAARIIREARQVGLEVPFLGTDGWDSPQFLEIGGSAVDNCYFSGHFSAESKAPNVEAFVQAFTQKFGTPPPPLAALSYDAVRSIADAATRAGTTEQKALRDALASTKDFSGVTGKISLDANRNPAKSAVITRVENGKFTYLETVEP